jgi:hypothetical protein
MTAKKAVSGKDMNNLPINNLATATTLDQAVNKGQMDTQSTADRSRANHTGTQLAATISDFDTQVRLSRLDQMTAPTGSVSLNSQKITNLLDPTANQEAATKVYVDNAVAALTGGLVFKGAVRAATATNTSVTSAPSTIDGVTPGTGNKVFLLTGQTTGSENGPWTWVSAGAAMTRPANWDTTAEAVPGSLWVVQEGSFDNQLAILSNDSFTLGTTTGTFVFLNPAAASDNDTGYTTTSPAVTAGNTWTVTHNLGSKAVQVAVYRTASPFDEVEVYITRDTTNTVGVTPDIAMSSGEYTVIVQKVI